MKFCIAVSSVTSPNVPIPLGGDIIKQMEFAHEFGFDAIEIHVPDCAQLEIMKLQKTASCLGISVATLGTGTIYGKYGLSLTDGDSEKRKELVRKIKEFINNAMVLGGMVTVGSIKGNIPKDSNRDDRLSCMGECMGEISGYATEKGVKILLEATNRYENNVLNTAKETREFIRRFQLENTLILLDTFHVNIEEQSIIGCIRDAGEYLGHIHFADNTRLYPGAGCFRFEEFNFAIKESGYCGYLSVECLPLPDSMTVARKSMEFFMNHFGK